MAKTMQITRKDVRKARSVLLKLIRDHGRAERTGCGSTTTSPTEKGFLERSQEILQDIDLSMFMEFGVKKTQ